MSKCRVTLKTCYDTKAEAENSAQYVSDLNEVELSTYLCEWCEMWHLTSKKETARVKKPKSRERRKW